MSSSKSVSFQGRGHTLGEQPSTDLWMPTIQSYKKPISLARMRVKAQPTVLNKTTNSIRRQLPPQKLASLSGTIRVKTPAIVKRPTLNEIKVLPKIQSTKTPDKTTASPRPKFSKPILPVSPPHFQKNIATLRSQKYTPSLVATSNHAAPSAEAIITAGRTQKKSVETINPVVPIEEDFPQFSVTYELATCSIPSAHNTTPPLPPLPSIQPSPPQLQQPLHDEPASSSIRHPFYYTNEHGQDSTFTSTGDIDMTGVPHSMIEHALVLPRLKKGPVAQVSVDFESPLSIIWESQTSGGSLKEGGVECREGGEESMDGFGPWDVRLVRDFWGRGLVMGLDGDGKSII
jgi:hypothetical protein